MYVTRGTDLDEGTRARFTARGIRTVDTPVAEVRSDGRGITGVLLTDGHVVSMPPATEAITSALPRERQGVASALNDVTREFGTALGVALLGALLSAGYRIAIAPRLDGVPAGTADTAREGIANAIGAAHGPGAQALVRAAQESFVDGWRTAMWAGVTVMAVLVVPILACGPRPPLNAT